MKETRVSMHSEPKKTIRRARVAVVAGIAVMLAAAVAPAAPEAPEVTHVTASQRPDSGLVDIYYDLSGGQEPMTVSVAISHDGGQTWSIRPSWGTLSGDAGPGVVNGTGKHIVWDAGRDQPGVRWEQTGVKVTATEAGSPGETITLNLPGDVPMELVRIPAGTFQMGRYPGEQDSYDWEDPQHPVTIGQDFYLGKYEVTKAQWEAVMGTTPWSGQSYVLDDPDSPAVYVSWTDAQAFISALNTHITNSGQGPATMRLPSEAEWEYACRAGTTTRFYWGDDPSYSQIGDYAWYENNAWDAGERYAHVVGQKLPNAWGLYDMSGNVWEWCQDDYHSSYTGAPTDGSAWGDGSASYRVLRGGRWAGSARYCRTARRSDNTPSNAYSAVGFRPARSF